MAETTVNLGGFDFINFKITESFPPNSVFSSVFAKPGVQTTPGLARGYVTGSAIDFMNQRLTHVCDFRFIFNIDIFASLGLVNPIAAIQRAIRNAKLKAANRMRDLLQKAIEVVKKIMSAITTALNFDATGQISLVVDIAKDTIRRVNQAIEDIADAIESVLEWVFFAQQIIELINWIKSLPEKITDQNTITDRKSLGALIHTLNNPNAYGTSFNDTFGNSVSISGNYVIVGANNEDDSGGPSGKVYIFNVSTGALVSTLDNPNAFGLSGDYFGDSVSISGNYAIVGTPQEDGDELYYAPIMQDGSVNLEEFAPVDLDTADMDEMELIQHHRFY